MSRRDEIISEIHHLEHKIDEHRGYLEKLEEGYQVISDLYVRIKEKAADPEASYDMTKCDMFKGKLEQEAEELQQELVGRIAVTLEDTSKHLSELQRAMERIRDLIEEWNREIDSLEAELASLPDEDIQRGI